MNNDDILNIISVKKSFFKKTLNGGGEEFDEQYYALDTKRLAVEKGKVTALIGGNGAGKTTLFNIISGFEKPDAGEIIYSPNGISTNLKDKKPFEVSKLGIGRMFQDNHIFHNMSVLENMLVADSNSFGEYPFISMLFKKKDNKMEESRTEKAKTIFQDLFGNNNPFWNKRHEAAGRLSYGQQRLLGLARLLMGDYKILLLDEPTSGVNPSTIRKCVEIINYFVEEKGLSIFLIEHNMQVVLEISNWCYFLSHGKEVAFGYADEVLNNDDVRKTYLGI
jgi:ABC-type branched-subunit amino acid transport system ATPase component